MYKFRNGFVEFTADNKFGILDQTGQIVIPPKYDRIFRGSVYDKSYREFEKEGLFPVQLNGKLGFADIYGNEFFDF